MLERNALNSMDFSRMTCLLALSGQKEQCGMDGVYLFIYFF